MSSSQIRYVVITPVRDEEAYLRFTIESMIRQTVQPLEWIIVNDGSTDGTADIIDEYSARFPWIRSVHRVNRGFRKSGGGVVEAFTDGLKEMIQRHWEFLVKLDGDLTFEATYFERCFEKFQSEARLGIGGGGIYHLDGDGMQRLESCPLFHVRGATKIYRRGCWEAIGGLLQAPGWDSIDELRANMLGWKTKSFIDLRLIHHRITGGADGRWRDLRKNGLANYIAGYQPVFMLIKCVLRTKPNTHILDGAALLYGYLTGYLKNVPQVNDPKLIAYVRQQQLNCLLGRESIWK